LCLTVRELNDALLLFTIEGSPGKMEVQVWLSAFGLPNSQFVIFSSSWEAQLKKVYSD